LVRQALNRRLLSESQFQSLDGLGVEWDRALIRDQRWELVYGRLDDFYRTFGHCRVPGKQEKLVSWIERPPQAKSLL
jgi:hypothetical protein